MKKTPIMLRSPESLMIKSPIFKKKFKISLNELNPENIRNILKYLRLSEIVAFYKSLKFNYKLQVVKQMLIRYLILTQRKFTKWEQQQFLDIIFLNENILINKQFKINFSQKDFHFKSTKPDEGNTPSPRVSSQQNSLIWYFQQKIGNDVRRTFLKSNSEFNNEESSEINKTNLYTSRVSRKKSQATEEILILKNQQVNNMQQYLNKVLMAISKKNPSLGYIQGFNYIVKNMYLTGFSEQESFKLMQYLIEYKKLGRLIENNMSGLRQLSYILKVHIYNYLPSVYKHFKKFDVEIEIFSTSWFITLFSEDFPPQIVNKLWHLFILEGWKIFIQFSIALLCCYQPNILQNNGPEIFQFMRSLLSKFNSQRKRKKDIEEKIWKLMASIQVSDYILEHLSREMQFIENDAQIQLWKLYQTENSKRTNSQKQFKQYPKCQGSVVNSRLCCDQVYPSTGCRSPKVARGFLFCRNINKT